ncbi:MAG: methylthioadenosine phosphorylase [Bacteroidetes bacterium RBG_19FT_COMBO_42_10]|nr:MAG: methylthioadenosine phosphorylase [Bacteroidetes bacterium RBG_19FT_COMBO_42_10]
MTRIGIIGGSGLENPDILNNPEKFVVDTPYGTLTSPLLAGTISNKEVLILSRHGWEHTVPPSQVNNRANIYALKEAGCTHIIATTACGSLREQIGRGDLVVPDQLIDFTHHRIHTFFEEFESGNMKHKSMADPFDESLRNLIVSSAENAGIKIHPKGTVITIEGPRFSTRAESKMFRMWGADIINMSVAPEAILANELGIPYAVLAMSTDYDSWKEDEVPVSWEEVLAVFDKNVNNVINLLLEVIKGIE